MTIIIEWRGNRNDSIRYCGAIPRTNSIGQSTMTPHCPKINKNRSGIHSPARMGNRSMAGELNPIYGLLNVIDTGTKPKWQINRGQIAPPPHQVCCTKQFQVPQIRRTKPATIKRHPASMPIQQFEPSPTLNSSRINRY